MDKSKETEDSQTAFKYDTHLQEVCDTLSKMMIDSAASFKERLTATNQLLDIEHLVQHGRDFDAISTTMKEVAGEGGSIPKALDQLSQLEKKRNRPSWMNDMEDEDEVDENTPEP